MSTNWNAGVNWPKNPLRKERYIVYLLLQLQLTDLCMGLGLISPNAVLHRCAEFEDNRRFAHSDILLTIPGNLTSTDQTVDFGIDDHVHPLTCKETFLKTVSWEDGVDLKEVKSRIRGERLRQSGKSSLHFTQHGYFHDGGNYYRPEEYCVKSISDDKIQLQLCPINCSDPETICLPKCCGVEEILVYWNFTCKPISGHGEHNWEPRLHHDSYPHQLSSDKEEQSRVHIQRRQVRCDYFDSWPLSDTHRPRHDPGSNKMDHFRIPWKLLRNKRPVFFNAFQKWRSLPAGEYCVDGYANWGRGGNGTYSGNSEMHSVLLLCASDDDESEMEVQKNKGAGAVWKSSLVLLTLSAFVPSLTRII